MAKESPDDDDEDIPFSQKSGLGKLLYILEFPFAFISFITIPPVEYEKLDKSWIFIYGVTSFIAIMTLKGCKKIIL